MDKPFFYASELSVPNVVHGCKCREKGILLDMFNPYREDFIKK